MNKQRMCDFRQQSSIRITLLDTIVNLICFRRCEYYYDSYFLMIFFSIKGTLFIGLCAAIQPESVQVAKKLSNTHAILTKVKVKKAKTKFILLWFDVCTRLKLLIRIYLQQVAKFKNCLNGTKHTKAITMGKRNFFLYK